MLYLPLLLNFWGCLEDRSSSLLLRPIVLQSLVPDVRALPHLPVIFQAEPAGSGLEINSAREWVEDLWFRALQLTLDPCTILFFSLKDMHKKKSSNNL